MKIHPLHKIVGKFVFEKFSCMPDFLIKRDFDCCLKSEPKEQLSLFTLGKSSRITRLCKVDILIIVRGEVKVIIEIEESSIIPTKICGKFLTSRLSRYYIPYKKKEIPISDRTLFVQVLSEERIPDKSSIQKQWLNIENTLRDMRDFNGRKMSYKLIFGKVKKFEDTHAQELIGYIEKFLQNANNE